MRLHLFLFHRYSETLRLGLKLGGHAYQDISRTLIIQQKTLSVDIFIIIKIDELL